MSILIIHNIEKLTVKVTSKKKKKKKKKKTATERKRDTLIEGISYNDQKVVSQGT